mmetsp:Transcript_26776/g.36975  ORF Transcript_26776/g.36975 Transcript_26776/m.36975 type:complete len:319 (+) Transcript_26776:1-957(+)
MGFSGAGLQGLLNEAALLAARERAHAVTPAHLLEGIERVAGGIKRETFVVPFQERLTVACHECGHAIVAAVVAAVTERLQADAHQDPWIQQLTTRNQARQVQKDGSLDFMDGVEERATQRRPGLPTKVSIIPRGDSALGYTLTLPEEDRHLHTEADLRGQLLTLLGGRAAEQQVFKRLTSGASDDLQRATDIAEAMVTQLGMTGAVGARVLVDRGQSRYLGAEGTHKSIGEPMQTLADDEISRLLKASDTLSLAIVEANRPILDRMVELLLENEVLEGPELDEFLGGDNCTYADETKLVNFLKDGQWEDSSTMLDIDT